MRAPELLQRRDVPGALANTAAAVILAAAVNGLVAALGLSGSDDGLREPAFAPPGWVIGAVWVVLFALMGLARWAAVRAEASRESLWAAALIGICVAYPFYTGGFEPIPSMVGNVATLVAAVFVAWRLGRVSRTAGALILPVVAWTAFACVLTGTQLAIN